MSAAEFFRPGRTYTDANGYMAPEITTYFHVEHITRHPEHGHLRAIGWSKSGAMGSRWHGDFRAEGEQDGWTELPNPLLPSDSEVKGTAVGERTPSPAINDERALALADHILTTGGVWTPAKAHAWLSRNATPAPSVRTVRRALKALAAHGYLTARYEVDRVTYTPNRSKQEEG